MIVYNITIQVSWEIAEEWLIWLQEDQIPEIMATNFFDDYKMYRLLDLEESEGPTFTIQFYTSSLERYKRYAADYASILREKSFARWADQFIAHHTYMQLVN